MADRPEAILLQGDASAVLAQLPEGCAQTCVTSPPYYGLRDYGVAGQLGGEATPQAYVASLVAVMRAVRRVLAGDGTLWLNLGDSYGPDKQLLGVPWRVALALQADGWVLRADVVWHKPNAMPETTRDRPSRGHEYLFLLAAQGRYHYDAAAIREPAAWERWGAQRSTKREGKAGIADRSKEEIAARFPKTKNKRTVWTIPTQSYKGAHFATFPEALVEPCVLAGSRPDDMVLDPFCGSGTVGVVARRLGRHAILVDLNPDYLALARGRLGPP